MLERDPRKRLTAHKVLCHPWIVDDRIAPDKPLDLAVLTRLKEFSAMNKLKKMAFTCYCRATLRGRDRGSWSQIRDLMDAADIDNSGTIDYGEFLAATLHLNKMEREENLVAAFSYFDKDGSGYITTDEIQQACKDFGLGDGHLEDIIKEIDQDNDGKIDYGEFAAMMRQGDGVEVGRTRTMRGNLNFNLADAFGVKDSS
ncbi:hypothetical protein MLD38_001619 [Melastoma candidum]|uniref:Uncharacterized protein n=1 Tax=Melastoma candidum TaxID=119954 RepID=A0ACB9SHS0_9MYRT|nr:hypothetical protein MLD38_001619 [Melastoma candidum]